MASAPDDFPTSSESRPGRLDTYAQVLAPLEPRLQKQANAAAVHREQQARRRRRADEAKFRREMEEWSQLVAADRLETTLRAAARFQVWALVRCLRSFQGMHAHRAR